MRKGHRPPHELSPQLKKFCDEYLRNGYDATNAGRFAGYSEAQAKAMATRMKKDPKVWQYIAVRKDEQSTREIVTKEWKMRRLKEIAEGDKTPIAAIAELNKMQGHYAPTKTVNANINAGVEMQVEQVQKLVEKFAKEY